MIFRSRSSLSLRTRSSSRTFHSSNASSCNKSHQSGVNTSREMVIAWRLTTGGAARGHRVSSCESGPKVSAPRYREARQQSTPRPRHPAARLYLVNIVVVIGSVAFALVITQVVLRHFFFSTHHLCHQLPRLSLAVFLSSASAIARHSRGTPPHSSNGRGWSLPLDAGQVGHTTYVTIRAKSA